MPFDRDALERTKLLGTLAVEDRIIGKQREHLATRIAELQFNSMNLNHQPNWAIQADHIIKRGSHKLQQELAGVRSSFTKTHSPKHQFTDPLLEHPEPDAITPPLPHALSALPDFTSYTSLKDREFLGYFREEKEKLAKKEHDVESREKRVVDLLADKTAQQAMDQQLWTLNSYKQAKHVNSQLTEQLEVLSAALREQGVQLARQSAQLDRQQKQLEQQQSQLREHHKLEEELQTKVQEYAALQQQVQRQSAELREKQQLYDEYVQAKLDKETDEELQKMLRQCLTGHYSSGSRLYDTSTHYPHQTNSPITQNYGISAPFTSSTSHGHHGNTRERVNNILDELKLTHTCHHHHNTSTRSDSDCCSSHKEHSHSHKSKKMGKSDGHRKHRARTTGYTSSPHRHYDNYHTPVANHAVTYRNGGSDSVSVSTAGSSQRADQGQYHSNNNYPNTGALQYANPPLFNNAMVPVTTEGVPAWPFPFPPVDLTNIDINELLAKIPVAPVVPADPAQQQQFMEGLAGLGLGVPFPVNYNEILQQLNLLSQRAAPT